MLGNGALKGFFPIAHCLTHWLKQQAFFPLNNLMCNNLVLVNWQLSDAI